MRRRIALQVDQFTALLATKLKLLIPKVLNVSKSLLDTEVDKVHIVPLAVVPVEAAVAEEGRSLLGEAEDTPGIADTETEEAFHIVAHRTADNQRMGVHSQVHFCYRPLAHLDCQEVDMDQQDYSYSLADFVAGGNLREYWVGSRLLSLMSV